MVLRLDNRCRGGMFALFGVLFATKLFDVFMFELVYVNAVVQTVSLLVYLHG